MEGRGTIGVRRGSGCEWDTPTRAHGQVVVWWCNRISVPLISVPP